MSAAYCRHCGARLAEPIEALAGECHNAEACLVTELDRAGYDELAPLGQLSSEHAAIDAALTDLEMWRARLRGREAQRERPAQLAG